MSPVSPEKEGSSHSFSLAWENLSFTVKSKGAPKALLSELNGLVPPGSTLAIMGPSGCGKTTLLNILADRVRNSSAVTGEIYINGKPRKSDQFRNISSYVAQNDSLMDIFTVRETISFAAGLSGPFFASGSEKRQRVEDLAQEMGIRGCLDNRVGGNLFKGISGGQMKRLSITLSLISNPFILLLDEPTSGLDSAATMGVMAHIQSLANKQGRTIVYSIHQPSSEVFQSFDLLCLLSEGRCVYFGKAEAAVNFFSGLNYKCPQYSNPADFFLTVINTDFEGHGDVDAIVKSFREGQSAKQIQDSIEKEKLSQNNQDDGKIKKFKSNWIVQFLYLTKRNLINSAINPGIYWVRIVMYFMLCLMMGTMYLKTNDDITDDMLVPLLFYCQAFLVFMAVAVLPFFMLQQPVFVRERSNGLIDVFPFVLSNFISALPGILLITVLSSVMVIFMTNLDGFWGFFVNLFLSLICAESLMHVLSASTPHYIIGIALGAGFFGMFMLAEGFMVPKDAIPGWWIWAHYIAFHTYSFRSFMYNQYSDKTDAVSTEIKTRYPVITEMDDDDFMYDMFILLGYGLLLQVVFFFIIFFFHTGKR
ncbi:uncharacterized protein LOC142340861 isoform X2 [Convolutriloba macropyga]